MEGTARARMRFLGGAFLSLAGVAMLLAGQGFSGNFPPWFLLGLSAMTGGMVLFWLGQEGEGGQPALLLSGLVLRLAFLPWFTHSDPSSSTLTGPLVKLIFWAVGHFGDPALAVKLLVVGCDMGVLWLLLAIFKKYKIELRHGWLYAAHPLPTLILVGGGHLEPVLVLPLFAGFLALHCGHLRRGILLVGLAAAIDTSMLLLLPFALRHLPKRQGLLVLLPLGLTLILGGDFPAHIPALAHFGTMIFPGAAAIAGTAVFVIGYLTLWALDGHRLRTVMLVLGLLLLSDPVVPPWYFAAILPFAVLFRSCPWLVLTATAPFMLLTALYLPPESGQWQQPHWLVALEFVPFLAVFLASLGRRSPLAPVNFAPPTALSILLPVRNEAANLGECLAAIAVPPAIPAEILVIDGGSDDDTLALAETDGRVRTLRSAAGRGIQLAAGYRAARGDLLVVVHADCRLGPATIETIWRHCTGHPHVAGGACTARYSHPARRFRFSEAVNDLRVLWLGIAFGDQVQFFRRAAIAPDKFPDYRLMEDIELSLLIQRAGALTLLPTPVVASHRRFEKVGSARNTFEVIAFFTSYLVLRSCGLIRDKGEAFYRCYYRIKMGKVEARLE
jgi:hypothetical protein